MREVQSYVVVWPVSRVGAHLHVWCCRKPQAVNVHRTSPPISCNLPTYSTHPLRLLYPACLGRTAAMAGGSVLHNMSLKGTAPISLTPIQYPTRHTFTAQQSTPDIFCIASYLQHTHHRHGSREQKEACCSSQQNNDKERDAGNRSFESNPRQPQCFSTSH
jgi:hypothetical protein